MPRPVILYSGAWADVGLDEFAQRANEWGYSGVELCCWGDHFEIQRAQTEADYCQNRLDLAARFELSIPVISNHRVAQAVCDPIDARHRAILPDYVWGNGDPKGVSQRAAEEMIATAQSAQKMGVSVVGGFTGSSIWSFVTGYPAPSQAMVAEGFKEFARRWNPILDVYRECGVKYASEIHPGQIAFDLYSAEMALDALGGREEFGFLFDPSHLHWQGVDPVEVLRRFPDRIFHVHVKDLTLALNGRSGILGSHLPEGDPRRGWNYRSPGRGGIDWETIIRGLNEIGYEGPLSVEWKDLGMDRDFGAEDACKFVKRLDFEPHPQLDQRTFRDS